VIADFDVKGETINEERNQEGREEEGRPEEKGQVASTTAAVQVLAAGPEGFGAFLVFAPS
jgi:hypothetical protein